MPNTPKGLTYPSSSSPVAVPADIQELATDVDGLIVPNTGGTYTGSVSFTQSPSVPTPTSGLHAVNKTYADAITDRFNKVGNLLTANQASGGDTLEDTTGYAASQATLSRSTAWAAQGTGSILVTATTDHPVVDLCPGGTGGVPVTPGETYTVTVDTKAGTAVGRSGELYINFWDSGGTWLSNTYSGWTQSTTPRTVVHTAVAPAGAAYMSPALAGWTAVATETFYFDKVGLWKGTGGQWAMPGTPILGLTDGLAKIGNLLTANQASGTDTLGDTATFTAQTNCTIASSTAQALQGSRSLAVTATAAAWTMTLSSQVPVDPGVAYTGSVASRAATAPAQCRVDIAFYTSGGSWLATVSGAQVSNTTTGWTTVTATGVAPAGAGLALVVYNFEAASVGHVHYADCWGLWAGAGGTWQMPGVPIVGQSSIAINNAVHLSGTGSPESVISAAPGSTYLQTDSVTDVKGWIRWVKATGTGNTGWVAGPEADTGRRDVTASLINGWASSGGSGKLILRRIGNQVTLTGYEPGLTAAGKTSDTFYNPPNGFQEPWQAYGAYGMLGVALNHSNGALAPILRSSDDGLLAANMTTSWTSVSMNLTWTTEDSWPSSLPGSAA